ncbi:MAG: S9 family peptidase [Sphingomonadaceae bacterium]|nr:S9 family peptidase [Sphingomonadaceae bacterium]
MRTMMAAALLMTAGAAAAVTPVEPAAKGPTIAPSPVTEDYFGTKVTDPYRGIEKLDAATLDWMRAQGKVTRQVLDSIGPRAAYLARMTALTGSFGAVKDVQFGGERLFYQERAPGRDQFDLMVREKDGTKRRLIDMAAYIAAHKNVPHAIDYYAPSRDGRKIAVGISAAGSEDSRLSVIDAASGRTLAGPVDRAQFGSPNWLDDGSGLFFVRLQALKPGQPISDKYNNATADFWDFKHAPVHVVGATQHLGPNADPIKTPAVLVVSGATMALLAVENGVQNEAEFYVAPLADARAGRAKWRQVVTTADAVTNIAADKDRVVLLTHRDAPTFKVTTMPWTGTAATARTIVPARLDRINESVAVARDGIYVGGREGLNGRPLRIAEGRIEKVALPYDGTVGSVVADPDHDGAVIDLDSYVHPPATLRIEGTRASDLHLDTNPPRDLKKDRAVEMTATAKDGTKVPLTVLTAAGKVTPRPLLLDAYGAYGISALPGFRPRYLAFVDAGGSYAACNVRGGGELGDAWRLGGKDANKPNTWRDAIACAEALIAAGYTTKDQLAITGTSAGGIMVGRAATERPDLFAAAITRVGDSNALRSETMVSGPANIPEFGTVKDPQGFKNLYEMDAYSHVQDGVTYPAWMLTTGLQDPRVAPWEAAKMAARLQASGTPRPVLLRIEEQAGHGLGTTRTTRDAEEADIAAFVLWRAGVPEWQPRP